MQLVQDGALHKAHFCDRAIKSPGWIANMFLVEVPRYKPMTCGLVFTIFR
ncbi:MAG: hypothetical protein ACI87O_002376 [Planctomycetota bacterium]|jgi:hypothetical protein